MQFASVGGCKLHPLPDVNCIRSEDCGAPKQRGAGARTGSATALYKRRTAAALTTGITFAVRSVYFG